MTYYPGNEWEKGDRTNQQFPYEDETRKRDRNQVGGQEIGGKLVKLVYTNRHGKHLRCQRNRNGFPNKVAYPVSERDLFINGLHEDHNTKHRCVRQLKSDIP